MAPHEATLDTILEYCWDRLAAATSGPGNPFRRGVFTTRHGEGVASRTVVIRSVDFEKRLITFNTDYRTAKANELLHHPQVAWLLYDAQTYTQIRMQGTGDLVVEPDRTEPHWRALPQPSYRSFLTSRPPSTPVCEWIIDVKERLLVPNPVFTEEDLEEARTNFAVVETTIDYLDWVWLAPDGTVRNARAQFKWDSESWAKSWVVP